MFLDLLREVITDEEIRLNSLLRGEMVGELMRKKDMDRDVFIFNAQKKLEAGGYIKLLFHFK